MECIWIDAALMAIPNFAIEEDAAHKLFDRITGIENLLSAKGIRIVISDNAQSDLWENSLGPDFDQIAAFLEIMGLDHVFTTRDIYRSYQTIFDRAVRASDSPGFEVREVGDLQCAPALLDGVNPIALRKISSCSLATVAVAQRFQDHWSLGSAFPTGELSFVDIDGIVGSIEGPGAILCGNLPQQVQARVRCIGGVADLVCESEALRIWCQADCASDLHFAISLQALALKRTIKPNAVFGDLVAFSVGSAFFDTLDAHQCLGAARFGTTTLEKCAHIVADTGVVDISIFGKAENREEGRRRSFDNAVAQRVHLTSASEALRLMFWRVGDSIEFANVGVKSELLIVEGVRGRAVTAELDRYL